MAVALLKEERRGEDGGGRRRGELEGDLQEGLAGTAAVARLTSRIGGEAVGRRVGWLGSGRVGGLHACLLDVVTWHSQIRPIQIQWFRSADLDLGGGWLVTEN